MAERDEHGSDKPQDISAHMLGCEISTDPLNPLQPIWQMCAFHHPGEDLSILQRAYDRAVRQHAPQRRKSGEPYIIHPLAVAQILADLGMGPLVVAAGLLHDTVEDTDYTLEECRKEFGDTVTGLVDGVTKLSKMDYGDSAQAETIRKMVVAMSRDVRVLVVKLADRVHNARTWRYVKTPSAQRKARETLDVYAPLANRLGMNAIKTELEELSFKVLYPKIYNEIVVLVARRAGQREVYLKQILEEVNADLKKQNVKAYVTGRPKDYFSIYQKMIVRGHDFENIYDLVGVRIIVDSIRDCYAALGAVHARWNPVPGRFKDYIAMPKLNMYQSLHTTVVGPGGKPVEIQIRTWDMHRRAEFGIAAHWKYKENGQAGRALSSPDKADRQREQGEEYRELSEADNLKWIQQLADWTSETPDSDEFLGSLKQDLGSAEVYVFTPKGKIVSLPADATPVDFAYAVHTEVGHRTMGARVNGRLVPLDTKLDNGDTVEILTSKSDTAGPSRDWLSFVKSPKARNKIRQWFSKERRSEAIEEGRDELTRAMRKRNMPISTLLTPEALIGVAEELNYPDPNAVFAAIGEGQVSTQNVISRLVKDVGPSEVDDEVEQEALPLQRVRNVDAAPGVSVKGVDNIWVKLAKCCMPVPGDAIVGFITRTQGVSVHRADCQNLLDLKKHQSDRIVDVSWTNANGTFLVKIQVEALDRPHLLSDVTKMLSDHGVNIISGSIATGEDRVATSQFVFEMADPQHLTTLLAAVRKIDGVFDCYRITGAKDSAEPKLRHM
ncbi:RelA/SpoT family protein [Bifidobacterium simiarum]|uniref:Bifunctional (P)ppGpp synthetase/guanosine-3',5'-bis(Diphosphate) 3'-pyrophosphohydrolase n=1 Tax=Bifidobacterium simiarum TaxID=2045441 RepID=A0A2M9HHD7_9BIFI|nr:bifunctional (p)ppGpp synthetase/guanosine-3',5'-bis(diphosphate) 3'-pyrophosphohydrolase [Bifidobacterium simiarum]MBT1165222.1 bifunctional (p)ppGpp synthetase/guanosine-3',5'-bis(diphosphate) 3'-pyrophosphohydrolase [Bifidobacterium simiarum]PJM76238.1 bifunctional (p)ppGpp synthetase/guanosine-3',5'-bis(diphosphate) 3'-pyrophosphohydrolase [Bifidobacterium simiarum]